MSPPIRSCGLVAFADLPQRFAFSQPLSTPARSVFVNATQRAVINTSLAPDGWQAAGQVMPRRIVCAEPSPDVGMAAAQSFGAALEASVGSAARLNTSAAQALIRLAERSVTIQYLRDGLYQACQAYANGAITSTTYSLILGGIDETLALPSGSNSAALVPQVLSYARGDDQPAPLRTAASRP